LVKNRTLGVRGRLRRWSHQPDGGFKRRGVAVLVGCYIRLVGSRWELGVALALTVGFGGNFVVKVDRKVPL
jgi:hypothetical protein